MAPQKSLMIMMICLLISLSASATSIATPKLSLAQKLAPKVCKSSIKKDLCIKTLSRPEALLAKNWTQLTSVVMKFGASEARTALNTIIEMAKKPCPPAKLKALKECKQVFRDFFDHFDLASSQIFYDPPMASYTIFRLFDGRNDCINAMKAANLQAPQIATANASQKSSKISPSFIGTKNSSF
ncbi:Pectinesterase inhibitor [Corchorus capsularis]|uniref:Pectinesterase inhibitor n=1 Tax=Corchorus capsularis TaxID=210143 RepID=A0A1R3J0G6_COCAP|nr:Pectinesterase inhibitor [Corchorus capsularis]